MNPLRFHYAISCPFFPEDDNDHATSVTLITPHVLASWPKSRYHTPLTAARRRVNRMDPTCPHGVDEDADFAWKLVNLAMRIVRGGVFEAGIAWDKFTDMRVVNMGEEMMQEVMFVPTMVEEGV
jgi:hypothetical protein